MKNQRGGYMPQMMPMQPGTSMPTNMMMFPNYMNDNYNVVENRLSSLEKKVKALENRISRLETPYQGNTQAYQSAQQQMPYQATQNNASNYNGEMYMM